MNRRSFNKIIVSSFVFSGDLLFAKSTDINSILVKEKIGDVKQYLKKMLQPDVPDIGDLYVNQSEREIFNSTLSQLRALLYKTGYSEFSTIDINTARTKISFSDEQIDYMKSLFSYDAEKYGFYGDKPLERFDKSINRHSLTKVNGIFCFDGKTVEKYNQAKAMIGHDIFMTSGIRSLVKQTYLFMDKTRSYNYNLSMASRTVAPPGYSFHGVGDFDIGSKKLSLSQNFTEKFAETDVFKKAAEDGFISLRYDIGNQLGVRYEPWHVKV